MSSFPSPNSIARVLLLVLLSLAISEARGQFKPGGRIIDERHHHLGSEPLETAWPEAAAEPEGVRLELKFQSQANATPWVLGIRQRNAIERALLLVNGAQIAAMKYNEQPDVFYYVVPAGQLKAGANTLSIIPTRGRRNMVFGPIHLYEKSLSQLHNLQQVTLSVNDADTGSAVPARLTIVDGQGKHVELFEAQSSDTAVRLGVVYTKGTPTTFALSEGEYTVYATRGMEWSRGEMKLSVRGDKPAEATLTIRREVDTTGFVAADTHIHTLTHSGHGDASMEERVITLAGEGVELAIATDHNHNTDYRPFQERASLNDYFTAVTGNEVSTPVGHMNGFPLDANDPPPPYNLKDWVKLVDGIRERGAKVVILNHPRGLLYTRYAFNQFRVNRASGEFPNTEHFPFDAMELTNPSGKFDMIYLLRDWFALLNYGRRVTAVSASDSHTVGDPVGWWRSYVPSATDDPARIDVDDACNRYLAGETSAAMGIFTDIRVDERYTMGQTFTPTSAKVQARVRVAAPSWVQPRRAILFLNGQQVAEKTLPENANAPTDVWLNFSVPVPNHDAHLVCAILGDGVKHPTISAMDKNTSFTYAVTNPVYLDGDRDGKYSSPRQTAAALLSRTGESVDDKWSAIADADEVIAVQMVSLLSQELGESARAELMQRVRAAAAQRPLLGEYAQYAWGDAKSDETKGDSAP